MNIFLACVRNLFTMNLQYYNCTPPPLKNFENFKRKINVFNIRDLEYMFDRNVQKKFEKKKKKD